MKQLIFAIIVGAAALACGGGIGGSAKMDIKAGGKDTSLSVKSSGSDRSVKTFTDVGGKVPGSLIQMIPYVFTVVILAGFMARSVAPKAIGTPFVKSR